MLKEDREERGTDIMKFVEGVRNINMEVQCLNQSVRSFLSHDHKKIPFAVYIIARILLTYVMRLY